MDNVLGRVLIARLVVVDVEGLEVLARPAVVDVEVLEERLVEVDATRLIVVCKVVAMDVGFEVAASADVIPGLLVTGLLIAEEAAVGLDPPFSTSMLRFATVELSNWSEVGRTLALKDAATLIADNEASTQILSLQPYGRADEAIEEEVIAVATGLLVMVLLNVEEAAVGLEPLLPTSMLMFAIVELSNGVEVGRILALRDAAALIADKEASTQNTSRQPYG